MKEVRKVLSVCLTVVMFLTLFISNATILQAQSAVTIADLRVISQTSDMYILQITLDGDLTQVGRVQCPTWTTAGGQDDIQPDWKTNNEASATGVGDASVYNYTVSISKHQYETGQYNTHVYVYDTSGNLLTAKAAGYIEMTPLSVSIDSIAVTEVTKQGYRVTATLSGNVDMIDRVQCPTWSTAGGQDDIQPGWKTSEVASASSEVVGTYTYYVSVADHNYDGGQYNTHIYVYGKNGKLMASKALSYIDVPSNTVGIEYTMTSDLTKHGYRIWVKLNGDVSMVDRVQCPTWTTAGGQDDIQPNWQKNEAASATRIEDDYFDYAVSITDHNGESGQYNTHAYVYGKNGKVLASFAIPVVKVPDVTVAVADTNIVNCNKDGYDVVVSLTGDIEEIDRVQFPTWTTADGQDDIQANWKTSETASGTKSSYTYVYHVNTADHAYLSGEYNTHVYVYGKNGKLLTSKALSCIDVPQPSVTFQNVSVRDVTKTGYWVDVTLSGDLAYVDRVQCPTWTTANGQDDIQSGWKTGSNASATAQGDGKYSYYVAVTDHKGDGGQYATHVYVYGKGGQLLTSTDCGYIDVPTTKVYIDSVEAVEVSRYAYKVKIHLSGNVEAIDRVQCPSWSAYDGQSDIQQGWQTAWNASAQLSSDGYYYYTVSKADHLGDSGKYYTHIYVYGASGKMLASDSRLTVNVPVCQVSVADGVAYLYDDGYQTVIQLAGDLAYVDHVQFPTWTTPGGQDDVQPNWQTNPDASGRKVEERTDCYYYNVFFEDHNWETNDYHTHVYIYDHSGALMGSCPAWDNIWNAN